jgi:porphobilinogen synthase
MHMKSYPDRRLRRLRMHAGLRSLVRETQLSPHDFIYPIFVTHGSGVKEELPSMPGVFHYSVDRLEEEIRDIRDAGLTSILLFGIPETKDERGSSAFDENGIVQQAARKIKSLAPELLVIADTCLCHYTTHGHCGILCEHGDHRGVTIDNDASLEVLVKTAVSQAKAGADVIAPSNMMDGYVRAIRRGLDEAGFVDTPILAYSVKYASAFYGPFRDAAHSAPQFGDRKSYQMDPANAREAIREAEADVLEGADMLMVKPGLAYLDIVRALRDRFDMPIAAYNVSGEYAMVKAAAERGWIDERAVVLEMLTGFKRAGADMILTYHAKDAARWLRE